MDSILPLIECINGIYSSNQSINRRQLSWFGDVTPAPINPLGCRQLQDRLPVAAESFLVTQTLWSLYALGVKV